MITPPLPSGSAPRSRLRGWIVVTVLLIFMIINFVDKSVLGVAVKPMLADLHLNLDQYGLASSGFFFLYFVSALVVGFAANRLRVRWILLTLAIVWSLAQFSMLTAAGLGTVLISRIVLGAAEGPAFPLANHAAYNWVPDQDRPVASSMLAGGAAGGILVGTPLIAYLVSAHGWRSAFLVTALITVAWCVVWAFVGKEGPLARPVARRSAPRTRAERRALWASYRKVFLSGTFLATVFAGFAANWATVQDGAYAPLYLQDALGLSLGQASAFVAVKQGFAVVVVFIGLGALMKAMLRRGVPTRHVRGTVSGVCLFVSGVSEAAFVLVPGAAGKLVFSCLSVLSLVIFAVSQTVCAEITPIAQRAGVLGAYSAVYSLAGVIAPALTGRIASAQGEVAGLQTSWLIVAALLVVSGVLAIVFIRPARDAARVAARLGHAGGLRPGVAEPAVVD
ncbi:MULTISPECIES: MFS transporter [unclassified Amycolatopsis]|uniref:MFS transporter n=1 Tax=unclassified Amycolatopsis TaxID=2618356 RepID=UPI0034535B13